jgi:hypothetical protein
MEYQEVLVEVRQLMLVALCQVLLVQAHPGKDMLVGLLMEAALILAVAVVVLVL